MKSYKTFGLSTIIMFIFAIIWTLGHNPLGPIFLAMDSIIITYAIFENRSNKTFYSIIVAVILVVMILTQYFWVHLSDPTIYVLLITFSIGLWIGCYVWLIPFNQLTKKTIILSITGHILLLTSLIALIGIFLNNFIIALFAGILIVMSILVSWLIRRRIPKVNALNDEFDNEHIKTSENYWFKYKISGGMPRPARWQGWTCCAIILLIPFIVLFFDRDPTTTVVVIGVSLFTLAMVSILKSNYRERIIEYRETIKK